jgi:L-aspartate oxidase
MRTTIQRVMSDDVAVVRSLDSLMDALETLAPMSATGIGHGSVDRIELRNMLVLAIEIVRSALHREESRGAHYRLDHPQTNPELDETHQVVKRQGQLTERTMTALASSLPTPAIS